MTLFPFRFESTPSVGSTRSLSTLAVSMDLLDSYFVIFWITNTFLSERDSVGLMEVLILRVTFQRPFKGPAETCQIQRHIPTS